MIILSAILAVLSAGMAWTHLAHPEAVPLYVVFSGVVMSAVVALSARIFVFLRMFNAGYGIAFAAFAVGFITFGLGGMPSWAPMWMQTLEPKPFLALAFTVFAAVVLVISRLPVIHETVGLSESYFTSKEPSRLLGLGFLNLTTGQIGRGFLIGIVLINFVQTYLLILFNQWYGALFDSFQNKDVVAFWLLVSTFLFLAVQWVILTVTEFLFGQYMQIRWRRHMSREYVSAWLEDDRHYRIQFLGERADNPDQRIAEDLRTYVTSTYSIASNLFSTFLSLAAFIQLLWSLSAAFASKTEGAFGWITSIPGFLVWVCLAYAIFVTVIGHLIGRPLIRKNYYKERTEADFRFGMARLREYSEQVALLDGQKAEQTHLFDSYERQVTATISLVQTMRDFRIFTFSIGQLTDVLPYVLVAPAYFAGIGTLGSLQQTAQAFSKVQSGFTVFLDLYETIAAYKASVNRINGFRASLAEASNLEGASRPIRTTPTETSNVIVRDLELALPGGRVISHVDELTLHPDQTTLLTGASGSGKSTLFRAIAGIWPFGKGRVESPRGKTMMLLPQRPYIPIGSLRRALAYPQDASIFSDKEISAAMCAVGLEHLCPRLDEIALWSQALSGGEQQRVAIVRALLKKPDWLLLDEATAALDEAMEERVYKVLGELLPQTTVVSIGHRRTLLAMHDRHINMRPNDDKSFSPENIVPA